MDFSTDNSLNYTLDPRTLPKSPGVFAGLAADAPFEDPKSGLQTIANNATLMPRLGAGVSYRVVQGLGAGAANIERGVGVLASNVPDQMQPTIAAAGPGATGFSLPDVASYGQPMKPKASTYNGGQAILDDARERLKSLTPDPVTTGTAVQVLHGLTKGLYELNAGALTGLPYAGAVAVGTTEGLGRSDELSQEGVTGGTNAALSLLTAGTSAAAAVIPFGWGAGVITKMATGSAANTTLGIANRYADHAILEANGYHDMAQQQKALDGTQVLTDAILGVGFGYMAHLHASEQAKIEQLRKIPGMEDAALTANLSNADARNSPGVPVDPLSANLHQDALNKAVKDVALNQPVDVSQTGVDKASMIERPEADTKIQRTALKDHLKESGLLDEEANLHDLNALFKPEKIESKPVKSLSINYSVDADGNHVVTSENGQSIARQRGDTLQQIQTETKSGAQGAGEGTARTERLIQEAQAQGLKYTSDTKVSDSAVKMYDRLERKGYEVTRNPASPDGEGNLLSDSGKPVFEVKPRETPLTQTEQIINAKPNMEIIHPETGEVMKASDALQQMNEYVANEQRDIPKAIQAALGCAGRF